ncbi:DUF2797 domain-containing protein [Polycladomyces subterraneus]|uniref:DUF2797 domain-containing protein n=1 Tax=Polycladomyces subterraneus TaxID=1016997 RepID=A0ABT8II69_9BACL|nr:DUF2797 domain-containing protein [Polycladomyces subterraneus]MDN4592473.1 DUF2797 domain-containing protein [Polycladomyces subterraneus]
MILTGHIRPLGHEYKTPISYLMRLDNEEIPLNDYLGKTIEINYLGEISCIYCGRKIKKSFNNGSCFPCFRDRPENDVCIVKPHLCHFHKGTCRDEDFGQTHCMQPHIVYLALSDDIKVGITRKPNMIKRWIDQGAVAAVPIAEVPDRKTAGEIEIHLSQFINDKTNWRRMLKNQIADKDLLAVRSDIKNQIPDQYQQFFDESHDVWTFEYPQLQIPDKIKSLSLDKQEHIKGNLIGVKAQYMILDNGVINMRKFSGYKVRVELYL